MNPNSSYWRSRSWVWVIRLSLVLIILAAGYARLHHSDSLLGPGKERVALAQHDLDIARRLITASESAGGRTYVLAVPLAQEPAMAKALFDFLGARLTKWDPEDRTAKAAVMLQFRGEELLAFLGTARFEVRSFFWLTGWPAILEVAFWTLFGTLCSLLYNIYDVRRRYAQEEEGDDPELGFDPREMPNHLAKLVFSPFVSVIVIFGYKYLADDAQEGIIETSTGVVIMSFLLGFYSARAMRMLDRIKDVLLPYDGPARAKETKPTPLVSATIELRLSPAAANAHAEALEELQAELDAARVILLPESGGDPVPAEPIGADNEPRFLAKVPAGRYAVRAQLTSSSGIGLEGHSEATLEKDTQLTLAMAEAEAMG